MFLYSSFLAPKIAVGGGGGIVGPIVTFCGVGNSGDSFNIGTASGDRVVIGMSAGVRGSATPRTLTGITYDGVAGSTPTTTGVGSTNAVTVGLSSRLITTGNTCTVVATHSGAVAISKIYVFTITGQASNTPGDTKAWKTGDSAVTINVANAGCVLMVAASCDGTLDAFSFTGVNSVDDQTFTGAANMRGAVGSVTNLPTEAARSLAISNSSTVKAFAAHTYS